MAAGKQGKDPSKASRTREVPKDEYPHVGPARRKDSETAVVHGSPAGAADESYMGLIRELPLRPLMTEGDHEAALEMVARLGRRRQAGRLDRGEGDYLSVLVRLIEDFEEARYPMPTVSGTELLRHMIEAKGITQARLAAETGLGVSTLSELASGKRPFTRKHVEALGRYFHVSPGAFLTDPEAADTR